MGRPFLFFSLVFLIFGCNEAKLSKTLILVGTKEELQKAISEAQPSDEIVMANGIWKDVLN